MYYHCPQKLYRGYSLAKSAVGWIPTIDLDTAVHVHVSPPASRVTMSILTTPNRDSLNLTGAGGYSPEVAPATQPWKLISYLFNSLTESGDTDLSLCTYFGRFGGRAADGDAGRYISYLFTTSFVSDLFASGLWWGQHTLRKHLHMAVGVYS